MPVTRYDRRGLDGVEVVRRMRLTELDNLLSELEHLNLRDMEVLPDPLSYRLLKAGIQHPGRASISDVIDLVFRAQERYLRAASVTRRWSAA